MAAKVGSNTNDPQTANARLFVGNLNTFALSQQDIEQVFRRYGFLDGISIHKGFAFIQYTFEHEARLALASENGKTYANQILDINLCSESKQKRPYPVPSPVGHIQNNNFMKTLPTMNRINRDLSKLPQISQPQRLGGPPAKKLCQDFSDFGVPASTGMRRTLVTLSDNSSNHSRRILPTQSAAVAAAKVAIAAHAAKRALPAQQAVRSATGSPLSNADILICGVCKLEFSNLHTLAQHKKLPCKLRFSCQCQTTPRPETEKETLILKCAKCDMTFFSAWTLVQHCQSEHEMIIYKDGKQVIDDTKGTTVKIDTPPKNDSTAQNNNNNNNDNDNNNNSDSSADGVKQEPKE